MNRKDAKLLKALHLSGDYKRACLPFGDGGLNGCQSVVDVFFGVGEGDEAGFVGARGEVDALVEDVPEEFLEE